MSHLEIRQLTMKRLPASDGLHQMKFHIPKQCTNYAPHDAQEHPHQ